MRKVLAWVKRRLARVLHLGHVEYVVNKERKFGSRHHYVIVGAVGYLEVEIHGEEHKVYHEGQAVLALTLREYEIAVERAEKNPSDLPTFLRKYVK